MNVAVVNRERVEAAARLLAEVSGPEVARVLEVLRVLAEPEDHVAQRSRIVLSQRLGQVNPAYLRFVTEGEG